MVVIAKTRMAKARALLTASRRERDLPFAEADMGLGWLVEVVWVKERGGRGRKRGKNE